MVKRAVSHEECVQILEDYITEQFTLKDLVTKHCKSLSSISKLVNFKSPYLISTFDSDLAAKVSKLDTISLGIRIRDSRDKKKPVIDYDKVFEKSRQKKAYLTPKIIDFLNSGRSVNEAVKEFGFSENCIRNWVREVKDDFFTKPGTNIKYQGNTGFYNTEYFIEKSRESHGDLYGYDRVEVSNSKDKVEIYCESCGEYFWQLAGPHVNGKGHRKCSQKRNAQVNFIPIEDKISRANQIHNNKYDYSLLVDNFTKADKVDIVCPEHGEFKQLWGNHIYLKNGCPICKSSKLELEISNYLSKNDIKFTAQKRFDCCRNKLPLPFDFYLNELGLILEAQGIQHFKPIEFWGGKEGLEKRQFRDKIKKDWVETSPHTLYYINYDENISLKLSSILAAKVDI